MPVTKDQALESISQGTLNPRILQKFFDDMKIRSFTYDYAIQRELADVQVRSIPISSGRSYMLKGAYSSTFNRVVEYTIPILFTLHGKRERYKRSEIFDKYIDFHQFFTHKEFFKYSVLISVNGKILTNYRIRCFNERVNICFLQSEFDNTEDGDILFYFIPDSVMGIVENPVPGMFHGTNIEAKHFLPKINYGKIERYIGYWIDKETKRGYMIPAISYNKNGDFFAINSLLPTDPTKYSLLVVGIKHLQEIVDFPAQTEWIQFEQKLMPVPKDNLIIMIQKDNAFQFNDGSVSLTEYYPNIYHIDNPNLYPLRFMEIYEDNSQNEHIVYDNEVKRYMKEMNLLDQYKLDSVPDILREFKPVEWVYGIEDYLKKHPYKTLDLTDEWPAFLYKMNTISEMLKNWCMLYQEYVQRTFGFLSGWYHKLSNYKNLDLKIRTSTGPDVNYDPDYTIEFAEKQYVFTYVHNVMTGDANSFCFFVDGKYTLPTKIIIYRGYQHVYFPRSLFKADSVIEVERFDGNIFTHKFNLNSDDGYTIEMKKIMHYDTVANNLFLVAEDGTFLNKDHVAMFVTDPELGEVPVDPDTSVFIITTKAKITLKPVNGYRGRVMLCCNDITYQYKARESGHDFFLEREEFINLNGYGYIGKCKKNLANRIRIYTEDGRLVTKRSYNLYEYKNYYDKPRFNIPIKHDDDRIFLISYIGYDERLIYHRDNIPNNGLIQLEGKVSRPISLAYHDIYLDGFRLTKYDIDIIAPFTFAIKNLAKFDTLSNIEIYEKTYIPDDYVKFEYGARSNFIADKLFQQGEDFYNKIIEGLDSITPTGSTEDVDKVRDWFYDFFHEYVPFHYLNADYRKDLEAYHHIFGETDTRLLMNADDRIRYLPTVKTHYYLSKDKTIEVYGSDPDKWPKNTRVYAGEVIVPDESISMEESEYRQYGYYRPDYDHVYDIPFKFVPETYEESEDAEGSIPHDGSGVEHKAGDLSTKDVDVPRYSIKNPESIA